MLKKLTSLILIIGMLIPSMQLHAENIHSETIVNTYDIKQVALSDVKSGNWFYEDVNYLVGKGIVNGYSDGSFKPNNNVNIDAFIKMLVTSIGFKVENGSDYWASTYIEKAIEEGIVGKDYFDDYARPITRGEMAVLAENTLRLIEDITPYRQYQFHISDYEDIDDSLKTSIMIATAKGIITGFNDYSFRPDELATRAQAATIISRIIDKSKRKETNLFKDKEEQLLDIKKDYILQEKNYQNVIDNSLDILLEKNYDFDVDKEQVKDSAKILLDEKIESILEEAERITGLDRNVIAEEVEEAEGNNDWRMEVNEKEGITVTVEDNLDGDIIILNIDDIGTYYEHFKNDFELYGYYCSSDENYYYFGEYDIFGFDGTKYNVLNDQEEKTVYISEIESEEEVDFAVLYNDESTYYKDIAKHNEVYITKDGYWGIYDLDNSGDGYLYHKYQNDSKFIREVTNNGDRGIGCYTTNKGGSYIGYYNGFNIEGMGVTLLANGLVIEDYFIDNLTTCTDAVFAMEDESIYAFNDEIDRIIGEIITDESESDTDKIKSLHNYLVKNISYSDEAVKDGLSNEEVNNAYSAIFDNKTVCLGYAEAFKMLLNRIGIESYIVYGDSDKDGEDDHAWNYVRFEDGYYHVDVTWDDPDRGSKVLYDYFKVSNNEMEKERNISFIPGFKVAINSQELDITSYYDYWGDTFTETPEVQRWYDIVIPIKIGDVVGNSSLESYYVVRSSNPDSEDDEGYVDTYDVTAEDSNSIYEFKIDYFYLTQEHVEDYINGEDIYIDVYVNDQLIDSIAYTPLIPDAEYELLDALLFASPYNDYHSIKYNETPYEKIQLMESDVIDLSENSYLYCSYQVMDNPYDNRGIIIDYLHMELVNNDTGKIVGSRTKVFGYIFDDTPKDIKMFIDNFEENTIVPGEYTFNVYTDRGGEPAISKGYTFVE